MKQTTDLLKKYLMDALGLRVDTARWPGTQALPQYLRTSYDFFVISLVEAPVLLALDRREPGVPPATLGKEVAQIRKRFDGEVVYVQTQMTSYNRSRLVRQRTPFIVPGNQMYLPMLGIDLREHFRRQHSAPETLSPACHLLFGEVQRQKSGRAAT